MHKINPCWNIYSIHPFEPGVERREHVCPELCREVAEDEPEDIHQIPGILPFMVTFCVKHGNSEHVAHAWKENRSDL